MKTKTLKFVFSIILFFSLFTAKAMGYNPYVNTYVISYIKCKVDKDCHDEIIARDWKFRYVSVDQVICQNDWCRVI
jgi:hypothetical protein